MNTVKILLGMLFALLLVFGCADQPPLAPGRMASETESTTHPELPVALAQSLAQQTGWEIDSLALQELAHSTHLAKGSPGDQIVNLQMKPLSGGVVHYTFQVRVGPGRYDMIRIHRVVKELLPGRPVKCSANLFLIHGDYKNFEGCFLPGVLSTRWSGDPGFAFYLAQNDVDVWGIDHAWTLIPSGETDFFFMASWGMQRMVDELNLSISVARISRMLSGIRSSGMLLCGYSSGSTTGFALLNQETQTSQILRNVSGFIPVDQGVLTNVAEWEAAMCSAVDNYRSLMNGGQYQDNNPLLTYGLPAFQDPNGESSLIPGFTNLQGALALGVFPFFAGVSSHFFAGTFSVDGVPTGLQYSNVDDWIDFMITAPPFEPLAYERDEYITSCPAAGDVPWDDHLREIRVPILYVMAGGGFGYTGEYTLGQLGSTDIRRLKVSLHSPVDAAVDFGHIDLFLARNARELAWKPMLQWIKAH